MIRFSTDFLVKGNFILGHLDWMVITLVLWQTLLNLQKTDSSFFHGRLESHVTNLCVFFFILMGGMEMYSGTP